MMAIQRLPEELSRKIAAGEVIERPLSVVKELIENSIDAGARAVEVELVQGGKVLISVKDDGCGIPAEELPLAVEKHATSKISAEEDLDAIATLGYRGEALSSIGAVSRFEIYSRRAGDREGAVLRYENGAAKVSAVPLRPGTTVVVRDLFYNLPARRKFLKSVTAEFRRVLKLIQDYAFAYPAIAFTLIHGGKTVFASSGGGSLKKLLAQTWGEEPEIFSSRCEGGRGSCALWWQDCGVQSRFQLISFVNGRRVGDPVIRSALTSFHWAARGNWLAMIVLPPEDVDVNVHPAKSEVLFRHSGEVYDLVRKAAVKFSREYASAPVPATVSGRDDGFAFTPQRRGDGASAFSHMPPREAHPFSRVEPPVFRAASPNSYPDRQAELAGGRLPFLPQPREVSGEDPLAPADDGVVYMGQLRQGHLVFADGDGLLILDPHAAHERVNFERILKECARPGGQQRLLTPVSLPPTLAHDALAHREELKELRFEVEDDGSLSSLPLHAKAAGIGPVELLRSALAAIGERQENSQSLLRAFATKACKASVKLTTRLAAPEALRLLEDLNACDEPNACPHGRPTALRMTGTALDKYFGRQGL